MLVHNRLMFEAPIDAGAAPPALDVGDPDPGEPAAWSGPSQDEWQALQQQNAELLEYVQGLQQPAAPVQQQQGPVVPDPFADDYADQLQAYVEAHIAPLRDFQQGVQQQEGHEQAMDVLADLAARDGEFDREEAFYRAQRYVQSGRIQDGEKALEQAAKDQRAVEARYREAGVALHTNQLATLSGVPGEPGSSYAQGVQQRQMGDYRQGGSVTDKFFRDGG